MMFHFDPLYFLMIAPAFLLAMWAQWKVQATYAAAQRMPAPLSGAAAARHVLDSAGLDSVAIEQVPGHLSDHYDPRHKVLRLSADNYHGHDLAAVGIAAQNDVPQCSVSRDANGTRSAILFGTNQKECSSNSQSSPNASRASDACNGSQR